MSVVLEAPKHSHSVVKVGLLIKLFFPPQDETSAFKLFNFGCGHVQCQFTSFVLTEK